MGGNTGSVLLHCLIFFQGTLDIWTFMWNLLIFKILDQKL